MVARQLGAATRFPGWLSYKAYGHGRAMLAPTGVFRQSGTLRVVCLRLLTTAVQRYYKMPEKPVVTTNNGLFVALGAAVQNQ